MTLRQQLFTAFNIEADEQQKIQSVITASFFAGLSLVFYYLGANALFLTTYQEKALPYVFIINSLLIMVLGTLYAALQNRIRFSRLLNSVTGILAATAFLMWLLYLLTEADAVAFMSLVWFRVLHTFTLLGLWELAGRLFNVRQAKRLFALAGLGVILGYITGGLLSSSIVQRIGAANLILLGSISMAVYLVMQFRYFSSLPILREAHSKAATPATPLRRLLRDNYVRLSFAIKISRVLVNTLAEYAFYQQAALTYPQRDQLASFLAVFMSVQGIALVIVTAFAAGRFISRYGMRVALQVSPVVLLVLAGAAAVYGALAGVNAILFFPLICLLELANLLLESAIASPSHAIFLQPLPEASRAAVRTTTDGWLGPIGTIIAGLLLLAFARLPNVPIIGVVVLIVVVALGWQLIALRAYQSYVIRLQDAIKLRFMHGISAPTEDVLLTAQPWSSSHPGDVLSPLALEHPANDTLNKELVHEQIRARAQDAFEILSISVQLDSTMDLLQHALDHELTRTRRQLFGLLSHLYDRSTILGAQYTFQRGSDAMRSNVMETLETLLPRELKTLILPLLDVIPDEKRVKALSSVFSVSPLPLSSQLQTLVAQPVSGWASDWTRACAVQTLAQVTPGMIERSIIQTLVSDDSERAEGITTMLALFEKVMILRGVDLFSETPDPVLAEVALVLVEQRASPGEAIIRKGEIGDRLYIVVDGEVQVHDQPVSDGTDILRVLGNGGIFGELSVLDAEPRSAYVTASQETLLLILDQESLYHLMVLNADITRGIMTNLCQKIRTQRPQDATTANASTVLSSG